MKAARFVYGLVLLPLVTLAEDARIQWRSFDPAAFSEAKAQRRPIIVNVGHEGCTACRMMETNTFSHPEVIALMNDAFVPIQVDSEARPDIGERYSDWAWPATAFLKPDGTQVFAIRGSRRPDDFVALLERVIARHQAGELKSDALAPYAAPSAQRDGPLEDILMQVRGQLDRSFDEARGGWGSAKILETAAPTLQLFQRGYFHDDTVSTQRAKLTAAGFLQQLDSVWGGMFYASFGTWNNVVHEKRLESQAAALNLFAEAFQVTGEARYAEGMANVHRYLRDWMSSAAGTFYSSQKDAGPALRDGMTMDDYYALDDAGRRELGLPFVDRAVYTDLNGRVIAALVRAFEATGEASYLGTARKAAEVLLAERQTDAGWMIQFRENDEIETSRRVHVVEATGYPYLRAQAHFGLAALALYQATNDVRWHEAARAIVNGMNAALGDAALGGWYGGPASEVDAVIGRRKPLEDNAAAARLVFWLGVLDKNTELKDAGERALRAVASPSIIKREGRVTGATVVTLELLTSGYVEFSVVGDPSDEKANALIAAARAVCEPRKLVHFEPAGRYPALPHAAMYICNDHQCTLPITNPANVPVQAAQFTPANIRRVANLR